MAIRRPILTSLALGLAAMIAAGATTFVLMGGGNAGGAGPAPCGQGGFDCIPNLKVDDVLRVLKAQGYRCGSDRPDSWKCTLQVGAARFESLGTQYEGRIHRLYGTVFLDEAVQPGESTLAFLQWIASLPYADDPQSVAEINAWVAKQVTEKTDAQAKIGGYEYEVSAGTPHRVILEVRMGLRR